ncbi:tetratricopeptide repeat protein [Solidesulfovibrio sp.]
MGNRIRTTLLLLGLVLAFPAMAAANPNEDYVQGMTAATKGDMDTAIAAFGRIIANPAVDAKNLASAYNLRGMCHEVKNELQQALADYTKALEIDVKLAEAYGNRAMLYMKLGDEAKAREDATAAKRIDRKVKVPDFK